MSNKPIGPDGHKQIADIAATGVPGEVNGKEVTEWMARWFVFVHDKFGAEHRGALLSLCIEHGMTMVLWAVKKHLGRELQRIDEHLDQDTGTLLDVLDLGWDRQLSKGVANDQP